MKRILQWCRYAVLFAFVSIGWLAAELFKSWREDEKIRISDVKDFSVAQADVVADPIGTAGGTAGTAGTGGATAGTGGTASCSVAAA